MKIRSRGLTVKYQPESVVIHYEGQSHGTSIQSGMKRYEIRNAERFKKKWGSWLKGRQYALGENLRLASENAKNKAVVLVVDHYVPQPDRDAGSKSMVHIMDFLISKGVIVKFLPQNYWYDPVYVKQLQQKGIEVFYGATGFDALNSFLVQSGDKLTACILSRPDVASAFISRIREYSAAIIYYYGHDIHFQRLELEAKYVDNSKTKDELNDEYQRVKDMETRLWTEADVVLYPSVDETNYLIKQFSNPKKYRTVPLFRYKNLSDEMPSVHGRSGLLFVGGFVHKPNIDGLQWFLSQVMPLLKVRIPEITISVIGSNPSAEVLSLKSDSISFSGFVTDEELSKYYQNARIVIAPLRFGGGLKGKVIEAMSHGVPVVTTPVGAQGLSDAQAFLGVANQPAGMVEKIGELMEDDVLWCTRAMLGKQFIKERFSDDAMVHVFPEILSSKR